VAVSTVRIALANIPRASSPDESVALAIEAIAEAGRAKADIICFPEAYVPGYRLMGGTVPPPDAMFLQRAWTRVAAAAANASVAVILGTERVVDEGVMISALVINRDGTKAGFQDKVQLDPSEDGTSTSAIIRPDGTVLAWQPYGKAGLLIADVDVSDATGLLASRLRS
jgi:predicted amidohydrolase